ncbi:hypothetical protein AB0B28_00395 [Glycomyces sp. NPDC046736]|uniref:hypothetical protein n=1 Tax=Glycomyces sp. NPDC046736 TaxID=3155615 RepID=UPI0033EDB651
MKLAHGWDESGTGASGPEGIAIVSMLLPMYAWTAPVVKKVATAMTPFERFVLKAAAELETLTAVDLVEITELPHEVAARTLHRLRGVGVLVAGEETEPRFSLEIEAAAQALEQAELYELRRDRIRLCYLSETDELFVIDRGRSLPRAKPVGKAPMHLSAAGRARSEFLDERIAEGRVIGLPGEVVEAVHDDADLPPELCPVYRCEGGLNGRELDLRLLDESRKPQPFRIEGAVALGSRLESLLDAMIEELTTQGFAPTGSQRDGARWVLNVSGEQAFKLIDEEIRLATPLRRTVADEEAMIATTVEFEPGDEQAAALFSLDLAVSALRAIDLKRLGIEDVEAAITLAAEHHQPAPTPEAVQAELWRRRDFQRVYALRAPVDFDYD